MCQQTQRQVYIVDYAEKGAICLYDFAGGQLTLRQKLVLNYPSYLAIENDKLYAVLREPYGSGKESGILHFDMAADGTLSNPSELQPTGGIGCCHLCVRDGVVYDANYVSGSVNLLGQKTVAHQGKGTHPQRQEAPHVHFTAVSPDGNYILVCDLGLDTIFVYDLQLNLVSAARVPDGHGVRHLIPSEDGKTIYTANELTSDISVFAYEPGKLSYITTVAGLPEGENRENTAAAIKRKGNTLYISHRGVDAIAVFDISQRIPQMTGIFGCGGHSPRDFEIVDDYIIVNNEDGVVAVFDAETHALTQTLQLQSTRCAIFR